MQRRDCQVIDLWSLDARNSVELFLRAATVAERARHERLAIRHRRYCFARAHGALRLVLAARTGYAPEQIRLRQAPAGQPRMPDGPSFSMSYGGDRAWVAISDQDRIGFDVVALDAGRQPLDSTFVTPADRLAIGKCVGTVSRPDLLAWAAKEASAKLTGDVARAPNEWRLRPGRALLVEADGHRPSEIELVDLGRNCVGAVARSVKCELQRTLRSWRFGSQ